LKESLLEMMDALGGVGRFVKRGEKILIKPNLLAPKPPEKAVVTHPCVIGAVASIIKDAGAFPSIGDSPGWGSARSVCGKGRILPVAEYYGTPIVELKTPQGAPLESFHQFDLAKEIEEFDALFNLPKLKTHGQMALTLAVKNSFGCVPGRRKVEWHLRSGVDREVFARMLLECSGKVNPRLSILDGIVGMDKNGPGSGRAREIGVLGVSEDPIALDSAVVSLLGVPAEQVPILKIAGEIAGAPLTGMVTTLKEPGDEFATSDFQLPPTAPLEFPIPPYLRKFFKNALTVRPSIDREICTLCENCLDQCPPSVMKKIKEEKIDIDLRNCIRCFCCQEICPSGAISIKKGWLLRLFT
jgi:uncharacterized protein (DUF362 family)/Pyruvate/2-oxoacid:ferredoxin oxidoreductase delta subunit